MDLEPVVRSVLRRQAGMFSNGDFVRGGGGEGGSVRRDGFSIIWGLL